MTIVVTGGKYLQMVKALDGQLRPSLVAYWVMVSLKAE